MDRRRLGDNATFALTSEERRRVNAVRQDWLGEHVPVSRDKNSVEDNQPPSRAGELLQTAAPVTAIVPPLPKRTYDCYSRDARTYFPVPSTSLASCPRRYAMAKKWRTR